MIAIIDYDAGNIRSVEKALLYLGTSPLVTRDSKEILAADHVILPGVGSFGDAMEKLRRYDLIPVICEVTARKIPFLGICLGEQLLFENSEETPGAEGLGILKGQCLRFPHEEGYKIPQMGWNSLSLCGDGRLFRDVPDGAFTYFVHSYYVKAGDPSVVKATVDYTARADVAVESGNVFGLQFHPEKSGAVGLRILRNFLAVGGASC